MFPFGTASKRQDKQIWMTKRESDSESSAMHKRQASLLTQEMPRNILNEIQRESHF